MLHGGRKCCRLHCPPYLSPPHLSTDETSQSLQHNMHCPALVFNGSHLQALPSLRTSTFVMREAATHFSEQAAAAKAPARQSVLGPRTPFERVAGSPASSGSYSVHLAQPGGLTRPSGTSRLASQRLPGSLGLGSQRSAAAAALPEVSAEEEPEPGFKLPRWECKLHRVGCEESVNVVL